MKKKKSWKTPAMQILRQSLEDSIRSVLDSILQWKHPAVEKSDMLYEVLNRQLNNIEKVSDTETQLKLLTLFLETDTVLGMLENEDYEDFVELYADASAFFIELVKDFENKGLAIQLVFELIVNHSGEDGRSAVFLSLSEMFSEEQNRALVPLLFQVLETEEKPENAHSILEAIRDVADGLDLPDEYARASFMQDPERSNHMLLDVANTYFVAENLPETKRLLDEVKDPAPGEEEEEFLDLLTAYYHKIGDIARTIETGERLYEKYPEIFNLIRLVEIVS